MGVCICWTHRTVTAWGCEECRAERLQKIIDDAVEKVGAEIRAIFDQSSFKARRPQVHREGGSRGCDYFLAHSAPAKAGFSNLATAATILTFGMQKSAFTCRGG